MRLAAGSGRTFAEIPGSPKTAEFQPFWSAREVARRTAKSPSRATARADRAERGAFWPARAPKKNQQSGVHYLAARVLDSVPVEVDDGPAASELGCRRRPSGK